MSKNKLVTLGVTAALLALCGSAGAQEEVLGGGVYRPGGANPSIPIMSSIQLPSATTNAQYGGGIGFWSAGTFAATALGRGVPLPIAGKLSGLSLLVPNLMATSGTNRLIINASINQVDSVEACGYTTSSVSPYLCQDTTATDSVNPGDIFQYHFNPNGVTWNQATASQASILLTSNSAEAALIGGTISAMGSATPYYVGLGSGATVPGNAGLTEINVSMIVPFPIKVTGLYFLPNVAELADAHIATICQNGATACTANPRSGIWCQAAASSSGGCCINQIGTATHIGGPSGPTCATGAPSMNFAAGDTISVQITCPFVTTFDCVTNASPGVGISYLPTPAGKSIIGVQANGNTIQFWGMWGGFASSAQTLYDLVPYLGTKTLTFGDLLACTGTNPGGTATRVIIAQASVPPTLPADRIPVTLSAANGPCAGANSAVLLGGSAPSSATWPASSGNLVDFAVTVTGAPANPNLTKIAASARIQ